MKTAWFAFFVTGMVVAAMALPLRAQTTIPALAATRPERTPPVNDADVVQALRRGADFLLQHKNHDNWERNPTWEADKLPQHGGETAMALWALLTMGQTTDDPQLNYKSDELAAAIVWLLHHEPKTVYVAAVQARVFSLLPAKSEYRAPLGQLKQALRESQLDNGGFSYALSPAELPETDLRTSSAAATATKPAAGPWDASNSRYGLMGIFAAADVEGGTELPLQPFWVSAEKFWRTHQNADGGWGYCETSTASRPALSAAGVASLYMIAAAGIQPPTKPDPALALGLAFVSKNFNPHQPEENYDYLYSILRVGQASGLRRLDGTDWYNDGAAALLAAQQPDGSWAGPSPTVATAYALLFLTQGREPLAFNKLNMGNDLIGATVATDATNLAHYLGRTFEQPLGWRLIALRDDLHDFSTAPILLMVLSRDPHFSAGDLDKLHQFTQAGGLIFSTGAGSSLTNTIGKYAGKMAEGHNLFRKLPADHVLYEGSNRGASVPPLWGVDNGVRELWIHAPIDMDAAWQKNAGGTGDAWRIPANLLRYVAGGTGLLRSPSPLSALSAKIPKDIISVDVAQIRYEGNWNPEPAAWPHMADLAARFHANLQITTIDPDALDARKTPLAHLTGTEKLTLSSAQVAQLKAYVDSGGLLFIDAAGAKPDFIASARALIAQMCPNSKLEPIPLNSPIYNGSIPRSIKADKINYRTFAAHPDGNEQTPRLEGVTLNGRCAIIFSADDITSGLLGTDTWGIAGYTPRSAQALTRNIIMYAQITAPRLN